MTEVWRDIFKNVSYKEAGRKSFRLPVIVPIVLYNGQAQWTVPLHFKETLNSPELFLDQVVDFQYILINVNSYQEEELLQLSNLLGAVFLVDQAKSIAEIIERLKKLSGVIKKMEPEEFRLFISWTEPYAVDSIRFCPFSSYPLLPVVIKKSVFLFVFNLLASQALREMPFLPRGYLSF